VLALVGQVAAQGQPPGRVDEPGAGVDADDLRHAGAQLEGGSPDRAAQVQRPCYPDAVGVGGVQEQAGDPLGETAGSAQWVAALSQEVLVGAVVQQQVPGQGGIGLVGARPVLVQPGGRVRTTVGGDSHANAG